MTRIQRARRRAYWRGFAFTLLTFATFIALLGLSDRITHL